MKKIFCLFLLLCLSGCADRYSLDKDRGPEAEGISTNNPLVLPPDYLLRAPEPAKTVKKKTKKTTKKSKQTKKQPFTNTDTQTKKQPFTNTDAQADN